MKVYDLMDAIGDLEALMDEAWITGYVKIHQRAGRNFMLRPWELRSPLEELEVTLEAARIVEEAALVALGEEDAQVVPLVPSPMNGKAA